MGQGQAQAVVISEPAASSTALQPAVSPVRAHSNKLLSEETQMIGGKKYLVQRFIITEQPLETYVETTELPQ
jgi:hypothetical protein